ncbi:MAG: GNAT family N-acetyltransferase [Myxococcota bacterium]
MPSLRNRVRVTRADRDEILDLRIRVLSVHGTRVSTLTRDWSPRSRHWAARLDGVVVGCASVMAMRGHVLRGMAVSVEHQRQGIGTALLEAIYAEVDGPMWCNARVVAVPFYERHGWVASGPRFEMPVAGATQRMEWTPPSGA